VVKEKSCIDAHRQQPGYNGGLESLLTIIPLELAERDIVELNDFGNFSRKGYRNGVVAQQCAGKSTASTNRNEFHIAPVEISCILDATMKPGYL